MFISLLKTDAAVETLMKTNYSPVKYKAFKCIHNLNILELHYKCNVMYPWFGWKIKNGELSANLMNSFRH